MHPSSNPCFRDLDEFRVEYHFAKKNVQIRQNQERKRRERTIAKKKGGGGEEEERRRNARV